MHPATYLILGLLIGFYFLKRRKSTSSLPLPPGPKPLPIIGNVHQAPKSHGWQTYREWSEEYGPIVHVNMLGQPVIILSTSKVAHELLAMHGPNFSDRPRLFLAELAMKGLNILMMNYTEQFKEHQRLQVSVLNATPAAAYLPFQALESQQLLLDLLENAGGSGIDVQGNFQRSTASIIHTLLYGFRIKDFNDPILQTVVKLNEEFSDFIQVGAHIVDQFPVLNNLPSFLAPWKAKAENHFATKRSLRDKNFQRGIESNSWNISKHLKKTVEKDNLTMPLDELAFELGVMIDAALDGTSDSLIWFIVACITQDNGFIAKAREELDVHVGRDRLPVPDDKPNLPYITAIVEELFRWRPAGPEGVPHMNREEVSYNGYTIPKGSVVIPNIWTISREEAVFGPSPDEFIPDRWMGKDGKTLQPFPAAAFGYGRRTCPGRHFARNVIWIVIARLVWAFDIKAGLSETGEPTVVDPIACTYGMVMRALPFKASFNPRGPWVREIITRDGDTYSKDIGAMLDQIGGEFTKM
ncbi:uncharacterized protein N7483_009327 [Penicillium malachiteum]|uniref:uncharacterized protein n=1 Tax=Penicillium malachiteum TaxID=1324776 RepID=UPI0025478084|nr:uncharacterized protein N7483_009327 [Penicillium malachiteum]KAJ5721393.1 hypothetical protein N7483_009327 [Penicillium malachiteum]